MKRHDLAGRTTPLAKTQFPFAACLLFTLALHAGVVLLGGPHRADAAGHPGTSMLVRVIAAKPAQASDHESATRAAPRPERRAQTASPAAMPRVGEQAHGPAAAIAQTEDETLVYDGEDFLPAERLGSSPYLPDAPVVLLTADRGWVEHMRLAIFIDSLGRVMRVKAQDDGAPAAQVKAIENALSGVRFSPGLLRGVPVKALLVVDGTIAEGRLIF